MIFKTEILAELDDNNKYNPEEYKVISTEICDTTRWSTIYDRIFKYEGKFYYTYFSMGSTECQDESPYDDEGDEIDCPEVFPIEVTVTKYLTQAEIDKEAA